MIAVIAAIAAVGTVGAGCGDDDAPVTTIATDPEATETTAGTPEEFIAAADARCAEANAAIANLSTGTEVSAVAVGQELEITQDLLEGLQSLSPPDDPALDSYFAALEDQISILGEQETAAAAGDAAAAGALEADLDAARSQALAAAEEFGFEDCGAQGTALPGDGDGTPAVPGETPVTPTTTTPAVPPETPTTPEPVEPAPEPVEPAPGGGAAPAPPPPPPDDSGGGSSGGVSPG